MLLCKIIDDGDEFSVICKRLIKKKRRRRLKFEK